MRTLRLLVSYDGTDFVGWQRQPNGPSVQGALEDALRRLTGAEVGVRGAGRTDAGVHALGQVVTFQTESRLPVDTFRRGLNALVPPSIAVLEAGEVEAGFDARFSASGKMYRYQIWNGLVRAPLLLRTHWHVARPLDVGAMQGAAGVLLGRHDFAAFRAADCERKTTVRQVRRVAVRWPDPGRREEIFIEVEATAFLKNMVRIIVGTLVEVGKGRMTAAQVEALLRGPAPARARAGPTAPAHGLLLYRVDYGPRTGV